jgi:phosphonopyruvate decarboxylase
MIAADATVKRLADAGVTLVAGVPCSMLGGLIEAASASEKLRYVPAANEGEAVAIAAGAWLGGGQGAVLLQNSGLGNAINPLTSLIAPSAIPLLMLIGWRGNPRRPDEPQHRLMGDITPRLLRLCGFEVHEIAAGKTWPTMSVTRQHPRQAFLVSDDSFKAACGSWDQGTPRVPSMHRDHRAGGIRPSRLEYLEVIREAAPMNTAIISTTGKCSRELYELGDEDRFFYQVGAMGCASSVGLGLALAHPRRVIVLDGDGAALMRLGALATIAVEAPTQLIHVVIDNESHESTGGQPTSSRWVDLGAVASGCGYRTVGQCDSLEGAFELMQWMLDEPGPAFLHAKAKQATNPGLGRPGLDPAAVAGRFREWSGSVR